MAGLLFADPAGSGMRPTKDVDVIAELTSYAEYSNFSERLRAFNLQEDRSNGAPTCRWRHGDLVIDIMPI